MPRAKSRYASLAIAFLFCALSASIAPSLSRVLDGATIVNSGSTNTVGWRITLHSDGSGRTGGRAFTIPRSLASKFFADVAAARNPRNPARGCMKSISFGFHLNVTWHGWTSPDLSCPAESELAESLTADVNRIVEIAKPSGGMRRVRFPLEPRRPPPTPA